MSEEHIGALSDKLILEEMKKGRIIIDPFVRENLNTSSHDVTLGEHFFTEKHVSSKVEVYNPYDKKNVDRVWGTRSVKATPLRRYLEGHDYFFNTVERIAKKHDFSMDEIHLPKPYENLFRGIDIDDKIMLLMPHETILGHTAEFIGGRGVITTMMKARSGIGRSFIEVCKCAGWGDVGYISRWTMEITNNSTKKIIPLVVGRRIAQLVFVYTGPTLMGDYARGIDSKYQSSTNIEEIKITWNPSSMLPKLYKDREVKKANL